MATDEAYEAAADALFHANELWPSFTTNPLAQSLGGPREARLRTAQVAVDAVWDLAVAEGRRQAAEAVGICGVGPCDLPAGHAGWHGAENPPPPLGPPSRVSWTHEAAGETP